MKVLIVEEREETRRKIKSFIRSEVQEFVEFQEGSEALADYRYYHPDLVLMDIEMRGRDGFDATAKIRAEFPNARVVIVSQWDSPALREEAREAGAESYVNQESLLPLRDIIQKSPTRG